MPELSENDLQTFLPLLEKCSPQQIIDWAFRVFPQIGLLTTGQKSGSVLAKLIFDAGRQIDLVFADTGVLFQETHETIERIGQTYHFPIKRYVPKQSFEEQTQEYGVLYLSHMGQEQCCHLRKIVPLLGIHQDYQALLGPLRRGEGGRRSKVPILSLDEALKVVRINPLANMEEVEFQALLEDPKTIINPLHFQGYPTIGCNRCTTPVREDEPERAGRWRHLSGVDYCGINPSDFGRKTLAIHLPEIVLENLKSQTLTA